MTFSRKKDSLTLVKDAQTFRTNRDCWARSNNRLGSLDGILLHIHRECRCFKNVQTIVGQGHVIREVKAAARLRDRFLVPMLH